MLKYIELKSGYSDNGPAWIGIVKQSKTGKTIYFNGKAFGRRNSVSGNYYDIETGEEYWISNIKKNGEDRHCAGAGRIEIESAAITEYLLMIGEAKLDKSRFTIVDTFPETDIAKFEKLLNEKIDRWIKRASVVTKPDTHLFSRKMRTIDKEYGPF